MPNLFNSIFKMAEHSVTKPLQAGKQLVTGHPGEAFKTLKHLPGDAERDAQKIAAGAGIRGWVGKHPNESIGALVASIFGGAAAMGAAGAGAAGAGGAAAGGAGAAGASGAAAGGGALAGTTAGATTAAGGTAAGTGTGGFMSTLMSNPQYVQLGMSMLQGSGGGQAQPSSLGGQSSLGGAGYQAYMYPGSSTQKGFTPISNKDTAVTGTDSAPITNTTIGQSSGNPTTPALNLTTQQPRSPTPVLNTNQNKDNQSFMQKMNTSSSDQWDNFMGKGVYDKTNKANLDAQGNLKAKNALGFQDKLNAGLTFASLLGNAFDRR